MLQTAYTHEQGKSLTKLNSSAWLQMLEINFSYTLLNERVIPVETLMHGSKNCKQLFLIPIITRKTLLTQTLVHDSKCHKMTFLIPISKSYTHNL